MYSPYDIKLYTIVYIKSPHLNFEVIVNVNRLSKALSPKLLPQGLLQNQSIWTFSVSQLNYF